MNHSEIVKNLNDYEELLKHCNYDDAKFIEKQCFELRKNCEDINIITKAVDLWKIAVNIRRQKYLNKMIQNLNENNERIQKFLNDTIPESILTKYLKM